MAERLDWDRLENLRAPNSLASALHHLGIQRIELVRKEMRDQESRAWIRVPVWLKGSYPFVDRLFKNEVGKEILQKTQEEVQDEAYRLQETVLKSNSLGLSEVAVPIVLRGERVGFVACGGFVTEHPIPGDVIIEERLKVLMLSAKESAEAVEEWKSLPRFSADKRAIVLTMVSLIAREVAKFFEESLASREREEAVSKNTFQDFVTVHTPLRTMLRRLQQMSGNEPTVLISGETGTGRELLARLIHKGSPRAHAEFRALHCASVSENLMEAELLGYEKGAFAGAYTTKQGLFEICQGGTLFLKEIGDLSLAMQLKILRFIEDKTYSRLGSNEIRSADVRVIASTQRNLKRLVQMGSFREDLLLRLSVVEFELPPLRQRKEDVPLLAEHFLRVFQKSMKKEEIHWKEEALAKLQLHHFPGNVRELRNEVERLVAIKESHSFIEVRDLAQKISDSYSPIEEIEKGKTLKALVDEYELKIIQEALMRYHWNKSKVAELFQITRQGLLKKISKYKLDKRRNP